ncbi:tripartite tricarboxylate transporter TctB family protein [Desulfotomaculum sp. 1211_IL3151]|uniref:tripartite tricarboxylate transporter TctB family protein n=1 Tax=Desulfotomaculum sp. 1211_IL3151 TaxID=3084055 RepID=UPI002FDAC898
MQKIDRISGTLLIAFAGYLTSSSIPMGLWKDDAPGPGFLPLLVGILLAVSALIMILGTFKDKASGKKGVLSKEGFIILSKVTGATIITCLLTNILGMIVSIGLLAGFLLLLFSEQRKLKTTIGMVITLPVVLYLIFQVGLDVAFPVGIFGF